MEALAEKTDLSEKEWREGRRKGLKLIKKLGTRLHHIWKNMRGRCYNPKKPDYISYGLRGIRVCQEWHNYKNFKAWALTHGYKDDQTIDRIDNNKGYYPENCRWVTMSENVAKRNRENGLITKEFADKIRYEYISGNISQAELGRKYGFSNNFIWQIVRGKTYVN